MKNDVEGWSREAKEHIILMLAAAAAVAFYLCPLAPEVLFSLFLYAYCLLASWCKHRENIGRWRRPRVSVFPVTSSIDTGCKRMNSFLIIRLSLLVWCTNTIIGYKHSWQYQHHQHVYKHRREQTLLSSAASTSSIIDKIYLYNTLSREKEIFKSTIPGKVSFYSCGPTVYGELLLLLLLLTQHLIRNATLDFAHVGNFRAFLTYDVLKRLLQYCGFDVDHVWHKAIFWVIWT